MIIYVEVNFLFQLIFFPLFLGMVMYARKNLKQRKNKN